MGFERFPAQDDQDWPVPTQYAKHPDQVGQDWPGGQYSAQPSYLVPEQISGLALWFEADYGFAGDASSWTDRAGGANATQADVAQRPALVGTGLNGKPTIRGDGSNDDMVTSAINMSAWTGFTLVLCLKDTAASVAVCVETGVPGGAGEGIALYPNGFAAGNFQFQWKGTSSAARSVRLNTGNDLSTPTLFVGVHDGSLAAADEVPILRLNRVDQAHTYDAGAAVETTGGFGTAGWKLFGRATSLHWPGDISMALVYSRALSLSEIQRIEEYANDKWGPF